MACLPNKLIVALTFLLAQPVFANPWIPAHLFNSDQVQLHLAFPQLQKIAKPRWGPSGTRGLLALPPTLFAGYLFEPVFFLRDGRLQRVEHLWSSDAYPCLARAVFDDVVQNMQARFGDSGAGVPELGDAAQGKTALWVVDDTDLIAYLQETNLQCSVRLVNKPRQLKNAETL